MARINLTLVLLGFLFPTMAQQQSLLSTAGGFYQNSEISVSWSLCEPVTETFIAGAYTFTQGFQQSKLEPVGVIEPKIDASFSIEVFPNPTQRMVFVKLNAEIHPPISVPNRYALYDIRGKKLAEEPIKEQQFLIDLNAYIEGVYYLRFYNSETNTQTTVIIQKIN